MEDFDERLRVLRLEIAQHPGTVANVEWEGVAASLGVFAGNARELAELLRSAATDVELAIELVQNVRPDAVRQQFQVELRRRLHNYAASAGSLVDHTRRLVSRYETDTEFRRNYEHQKDAVAAAPVTAFFNDLRNFILHRRLPFLGHRMSFSGPAADDQYFESTVTIGAAGLLEWDGWSAAARDYIRAAPDGEINLLEAMEAHGQIIRGLYGWLLPQFEALHSAEVNAANELVGLYNRLLSGGREE